MLPILFKETVPSIVWDGFDFFVFLRFSVVKGSQCITDIILQRNEGDTEAGWFGMRDQKVSIYKNRPGVPMDFLFRRGTET